MSATGYLLKAGGLYGREVDVLGAESDEPHSEPNTEARPAASNPWRRVLRRLRYSQPFNAVATAGVRRLLQLVNRPSETVIKHLHRLGTVESQLPNGRVLRLWSRADDWVSNQVFWRGWRGYDPETGPLFFELARQARVTLDVGAHVGFYTLLAGHANPDGVVISFEPLPANYRRLCENVRRNSLANTVCLQLAVDEKDGSTEFFHVAAGLPCSSSLSRDFMAGVEGVVASNVEVVRLDTLLARRGIQRVDLIKIDTESTEPRVLASLGSFLSRDLPDVVCEVLAGRGAELDLDAITRSYGYAAYLLTSEGPRLRERPVGDAIFLNYLFSTRAATEVARLWRAATSVLRA